MQLNLPQVRYQYFDFHNECKKMRWDRISLLIDKLKDDLVKQGCEFTLKLFFRSLMYHVRYFELDANQPSPVILQRGTVRTNCMDNLDRTNVVQATLAKWTLDRQLEKLGILLPGESIDDYESFSKDFRESMYQIVLTARLSYSSVFVSVG